MVIKSGYSKCWFVIRVTLIVVLCIFAALREIKAQTLSPQTKQQINAILDAPNLKEAHIGISILDLGIVKDAQAFPAKPYLGKPHRVLFERDANKSFMPASNMKLFTAAIALELLGKERTFSTRVETEKSALLQQGSPVSVMLHLIGGGDPSLSAQGINDLAQQISTSGLKSEVDSIVANGSAYTAETIEGKYPFGWTSDDTRWYYGPEISALAFNRNQVDLTIVGNSVAGKPAQIIVDGYPLPDIMSIELAKFHWRTPDPILGRLFNGVITVEPKHKLSDDETLCWQWSVLSTLTNAYQGRDIATYKEGAVLNLEVYGKVAPNQKISEGLAVPNSGIVAALTLKSNLKKKGIAVAEYSQIEGITRNWGQEPFKGKFKIAQHDSPPLKVLFQRFLKNSDNLYAEMLLRNAAYYYDGTGGDKAGPRAHELLRKWLIGQGIDITALRFEDGSGLSRYNLLTPRATSELLAAINAMKDGDVIWNALPIGGVDGTMKNRVKITPAQNNARAKSGTFSIASNLSGYVTTRDNHRLAISLYMNFARNNVAARKAQDAVFVALANTRIQTAKPQVASRSQSTPATARR